MIPRIFIKQTDVLLLNKSCDAPFIFQNTIQLNTMKKLTYKEAFDKITEAYIKGEIKPLEAKFCFCGNLCNNTTYWREGFNINSDHHNDSHGYSGKELRRMEVALLYHRDMLEIACSEWHDNYENALFNGMCAALEVLKQIHKERGEDVDGVQEFKKRKIISD